MARYDENLGAMSYDNLINNSGIPLVTALRKIKGGQGVMKRGTALALSTGTAGDGSLVLLGTTAVADEVLTANAILADEVDTGTAGVQGEVYLTGHFNTNALITKDEAELTAPQIEEFRIRGIFLDAMMK